MKRKLGTDNRNFSLSNSGQPTPKNAEGRGEKKKSADSINDNVNAELRGKTLKTYLFILKRGEPIGVRELQRGLSLSSPSVAYHHLEKLERLGLIEKNEYGQYTTTKNVDVNVLQAFTQVGKLLLPRFTFYAVFFTTLLIGYVAIFGGNANVFAIAFGVFASSFAWYETMRTWKRRPF
jgi:DNA-binding transcriptional ArsR family regulator